jgi:hypothetical protein
MAPNLAPTCLVLARVPKTRSGGTGVWLAPLLLNPGRADRQVARRATELSSLPGVDSPHDLLYRIHHQGILEVVGGGVRSRLIPPRTPGIRDQALAGGPSSPDAFHPNRTMPSERSQVGIGESCSTRRFAVPEKRTIHDVSKSRPVR